MDPVFDVVSTIVFLVVDLVIGVLAILLLARIFPRVFLKSRGFDFLTKGNAAAALLLVSLIVSMALLCSDVVMTVQQNLHQAAQVPRSERGGFVLTTALFGFLQVLASIVLALLVGFVSARLFDALTRGINELEEIGTRGNLAVGIVLGGLIIGLTILIRYPFSALVSFLVPLPKYALPL